MFDENRSKAELDALNKEFAVLVKQLSEEELQRIRFVEYVLSNGENLREYAELTQLTVENLNKFINIYEEIMAYVLLLEERGHQSEQFKELNMRYQLLEGMIKKLGRIRKKQVRTLKDKIKLTRFSGWFLKRRIRDELEQVRLVLALVNKNREEVEQLKVLVRRERQKKIAITAVSGTAFLLPVGGTAFMILSKAVLDWLNCFTPNYKKLKGLVG